MIRYPAAALCALCVALPAAAQSVQAEAVSPLVLQTAASLPPALRPSVAALTEVPAVWGLLQGSDSVRLTGVPLGPSRTVNLQLQRMDPFTADAVVVEVAQDADGHLVERTIPRPQGDFFSGMVEGDPSSRVMIAHSVAGTFGFVQDAHGTAIISSGPFGGSGPVLSYQMAELPEGAINWKEFHCSADDLAPAGPVFTGHHGEDEGGVAGGNPCRQVRVAVETDYEFSAVFGGNTSASAAYAATIFAGCYTIYQRDLQVLPQVCYLRLWATSIDPWNAASSGAQLSEFQGFWNSNMSSVNRNVAHFLSARGLGGGVAYLSALCGTSAYGVSGNLSGFFPYPMQDNNGQNWDIMVVNHEIGHNFGAPHTHNYCPPLDECPPSAYWGSCQTQQVCITNGTIMSYCHLCAGGLANVQLNFHPQNIASMSDYLNSSGCNLLGSAVPPVGTDDVLTVPNGLTSDIDVLANDLPYNCESVSIATAALQPGSSATLTILPGAGPNGRDLVRYQPAAGFTGQDTFKYLLRDPANQLSQLISVTLSVQGLRTPENPINTLPALAVGYYALTSPTVLPNFDALNAYASSTAPTINYPSTNGVFAGSGRSDNVGARWTGWVFAPVNGFYTFSVNSDDGSRLLVGTTVVVNNDGLHGMQEVSGTIGLLTGWHAFTVEFFEAGGGAGCIVQMQGPTMAKAPIPEANLRHGGQPNVYDMNHDGVVDGVDLGIFLGSFGITGTGADFNRDGQVDGTDLGLLLGAWSS